MKIDDDMPFRDGVVLDRPVKNGCGSFVNAGMRKEVRIDKNLKPGLRVTVKMGDTSKPGVCILFESRPVAIQECYVHLHVPVLVKV